MKALKSKDDLKALLDSKVLEFNRTEFIASDPICIPHEFTALQDIEIAGFFAATLAWGQRKTIISKCRQLIALMDNAPYDFVRHHKEADLRKLKGFKHRTFNLTDLLYFVDFFKRYYSKHDSLENAFVNGSNSTMEARLINFHNQFFSFEDYPTRTRKHIATPQRKSACKRINMFLRWMVRHDDQGVDFGLWKKIKPSELICPIDLHVERVARRLKLIKRKQVDWRTAIELTDNLRHFDSDDPVKYDFALFGLGITDR